MCRVLPYSKYLEKDKQTMERESYYRRTSRATLSADVKLSHAQSLQSLNEVRSLSESIGERIRSASGLITNQSNDIRKHLLMVRETTERYCDLQKRLALAAQLMDESYEASLPRATQQLRNTTSLKSATAGYVPRKLSRPSSVLSITPILEDHEPAKLNLAKKNRFSVPYIERRVASCCDVRHQSEPGDEADSEFSDSPRRDMEDALSDIDSGVALEGLPGQSWKTPPAGISLASFRQKVAESGRITSSEEIVAGYLEKQHFRKLKPLQRPNSLVALEKLESSIKLSQREWCSGSSYLSPQVRLDDDAASDAASRWSSVSNTRGSRRIPEQCFESDCCVEYPSSTVSSPERLHVTSEQDVQRKYSTPTLLYNGRRCHGRREIGNRTSLLGRNDLRSPIRDDFAFKWSSMPNLLSDGDENVTEMDEIFRAKRSAAHGKATGKRRKEDPWCGSRKEVFVIRDENSNPKLFLQKEAQRKSGKEKRFFGFLRRNSKAKRKETISKPVEAYAIARQLTVRHELDSPYQIELHRPANGPYGFHLQRGYEENTESVFVSKLADSNARKFLSGMLNEGDEIVRINGRLLKTMTMKEINHFMRDSEKLLITVLPKPDRVKKRYGSGKS